MPGTQDDSSQSWNVAPVSRQETTLDLLVPRGAQVQAVRLTVTGKSYPFSENLLDPQVGATVAEFLPTGANSGIGGLVADMHGLWAAHGLSIQATWTTGTNRHCHLQAWAGTTWQKPEPRNCYVLQLTKGTSKRYSFPEFEVQKMMLVFYDTDTPTETTPTMNTALDELTLDCSSVPFNLSLRIGDAPPFWTNAAPLVGTLTTPDFAQALDDYLAGDVLPEGQQEHHVPLIIRSDTLGEVAIALDAFDYFFVVDRFADGTAEKALSFACPGPWTQIVEVDLPAGAEIQKATVDLAVSCGDDRFVKGHGPEAEASGPYAAMVSADRWTAQEVVLDGDAVLTGVDLCLGRMSEAARVAVEVQADVNGAPSGVALVEIECSLDPASDRACWHCLALPTPLALSAQKSYWLILKGREGQASWQARSVAAPSPSLCTSKDAGSSWTGYDQTLEGVRIAGSIRLRHLPQAWLPPIEMNVGRARIDLGKFAQPDSAEFSVDLKEALTVTGRVPLSITAASAGQLTLSNLRIEYCPAEAAGETAGPLAGWDVEILEGVGRVYAGRLRESGVTTLAQLVQVDPARLQAGIPQKRLLELQHKAEMALGVEIDARQFAPLLDLMVGEILRTSAVELSRRTGLPPATIEPLRKALRSLLVVLDSAAVNRMRLRELIEA